MFWTFLLIVAFTLAAVAVVRADGKKSELGWAAAILAVYLLAAQLGFHW